MADPTPANPPAPQRQVEVQVVYFNGFAAGFSSSDMSLRIMLDNVPMMELKSSFTTFKTLASALSKTIEQFEKVTGHTIMTTTEVSKKIKSSNPPKEELL